MSGFASYTALLAMWTAAGANVSKHKAARAQRFLFKHRDAVKHRKLVRRFIAAQQLHQSQVSAERVRQRLGWGRAA